MLNTSRLIRRLSEFDVLHAQFTFPIGFSLAFLISLNLINKPLIVHTHGHDVFTVPSINYGVRRSRLGKFLTNYAWKRANKVLAVCEKSKMEIAHAGITADKIAVLYNGVDELLFKKHAAEVPTELSTLRDSSDFVFLSIASLVPVKNHERLVRAFANLTEKYGLKYRIKLILIGSQPNYYTVSLNKHEDIIYLGKKAHRDLPSYYSAADAFVLPSLNEAHPWSMLEAMSCELPVLASGVGGIPETLEDSDFLIDPYEEKDIETKLEGLVRMTQEERKNIGSANREKVLKRFTLGLHVEKLKKIYQDCITSK